MLNNALYHVALMC